MPAMRRLSPGWAWASTLLLLAAVLLGAWTLSLSQLLPAGELASRLRAAQDYAAAHPLLAALAYVAFYTALVAASVPTGTALTVSGGALFGPALGTALAVAGATAGAISLFLAARSTVGAALARRNAALLARVQPRLERDGFAGLLALRFLPVVPFWLVNLAAGIVGMRLLPFALATGIGIIPATAVFASAGAGFGDALAAGMPPGPSLLLRPGILLPLLALALLCLLPIVVRQTRRIADGDRQEGCWRSLCAQAVRIRSAGSRVFHHGRRTCCMRQGAHSGSDEKNHGDAARRGAGPARGRRARGVRLGRGGRAH